MPDANNHRVAPGHPPRPGGDGVGLLETAARGGMTAFAGTVLGRLISLGLQILVSRSFGPECFGLYATGIIICQIMRILSSLGLQKGGMRYLAIAVERRDAEALPGIINTATYLPFAGGIIMAVIGFFLAPFLATICFHRPDMANVLRHFVMAVPFLSLLQISADLSRAFKTTRYAAMIEDVFFAALQMALFLAFRAAGFGFESVLYSFISSTIMASFVMLSLTRMQAGRLGRDPLKPAAKHHNLALPENWREILVYSMPLMPLGLLFVANNFMDIIMLNILGSAKGVGEYAAASRWIMIFVLIMQPLNLIFGPMIASQFGAGKKEETTLLYRAATRWMFLMILPVFVFTALARRPMMMAFGSGFESASPDVLGILMLSVVFSALSGGAGMVLTMCGLQTVELACIGGNLALNLGLNLLLIPRFGVIGAAFSSVIARTTADAARITMVHRRLNMRPFTPAFKWPVLIALIAVILCVYIGPAFKPMLQLAMGMAGFIVMVLVIVTAGLDPHDRELFQRLVRKVKGRRPVPPEASCDGNRKED